GYPSAQQAAPPQGQAPAGPIPNHGGAEQSPDADFFVPPPPEIGEVLSAHTNMRQHHEPWPPAAIVAWCVLGAGIGVLIGAFLMAVIRVRNPAPLLVLPLGLGGIGLAIALWATGFKRRCTYVGREGAARFVCSGSRENVSVREVFLFRDALELRT